MLCTSCRTKLCDTFIFVSIYLFLSLPFHHIQTLHTCNSQYIKVEWCSCSLTWSNYVCLIACARARTRLISLWCIGDWIGYVIQFIFLCSISVLVFQTAFPHNSPSPSPTDTSITISFTQFKICGLLLLLLQLFHYSIHNLSEHSAFSPHNGMP